MTVVDPGIDLVGSCTPGSLLSTEGGRLSTPSIREPRCVHPGGERPASDCTICRDDAPLRQWKADWAAWLAEHPDSEEARNGYESWVRDR